MSGKIIIYVIIFAAWMFFKAYRKAVKQERDKKGTGSAPRPRKKNILEELIEKAQEMERKEQERRRRTYEPEPVPQPKPEPVREAVSSEKADWEFGVDELKTSKETHKKHGNFKKNFEQSEIREEDSVGAEIARNFDAREAVIYSEIMNRPYAD
jgi:hypothetical protein